MRRIIYALLIISILFPLSVFASGNITVGPSSITVEVGSSKSITITAKNTIGDVSIKSSDSSIAKVNASEWGTGMVDEGQTKNGSIKVTGVNTGTATITFTIDAATFDGDDLSGQKRTVTVNVIPKTTTKSTTKNTTTTTTTTTKKIEIEEQDTNNNLTNLCIKGFTCTKVNDTTYKVVVPEYTTSINIEGLKESDKATITGTGEKELTNQTNKFTITVTSESGETKEYTLEVINEKKEEIQQKEEPNFYRIIAIVEFIFNVVLLICFISIKKKY